MADALGILERSLNPETLLSLFSGGELQACSTSHSATCHNAIQQMSSSIQHVRENACCAFFLLS